MAKTQAKPANSGKKTAAPTPPVPSSAEILAELERLRRLPGGAERSRRAWQLLTDSQHIPDFPVVLDFALEHGLVLACGAPAQRRGPAPSVSWINPIDGSEMIWIPPGPFYVGKNRVRAEARGFSLARFPVTNAQFKLFLDATGYTPLHEHPLPETFLLHWVKGKPPKKLETHPVVFVSYLDALEYCRWAGLSLPTEWQWEKAARGPDGRPYPWGTQLPRKSIGNLTNVGTTGTCAVGRFPRTRTPYGCEDLVGNVSEWCQPTEEGEYGAAPTAWPESSWEEGLYAVVRGACFLRIVPARMVSAHRRRLAVIRRNQWVGFRPACFLPCRPVE